MKIKISTWYGPANYGTALQAIALKYYLESLGNKVEFLEDKRIQELVIVDNKREIRSIIKKIFNPVKWYKLLYRKQFLMKSHLQNNYLIQNAKVYMIESAIDIQKLNKETDLFITGGDQVWNPYVLEEKHLLEMASDDIPKISYGTSVGVKHIPIELRNRYKKSLSRYSAISVREESSKEALKEFLDIPIEVVVDPTLLLSSTQWDFLSKPKDLSKNIFHTPYIFCYFVGTRKTYWEYVEKIRKATKYSVIVVPINDEAFWNKYKKYVAVSPVEFLMLIQNASIVCTDSFHATLFSIVYQKEFYTLKRFEDNTKESQNSRLTDFLENLGLTEHFISNESIFTRNPISFYEEVNKKLEKEREESRKWLRDTIQRVL